MTRGSLRGPRTLWGSFGGSWNCRVANERHCWCTSLHFSMDVSSHKHFGTYTNRRCGCSGTWMFQHGNISTWGIFGIGNFQHEEFLAQEHFGTGIFWQRGHFSTWGLVGTESFRHRDFWHLEFWWLGFFGTLTILTPLIGPIYTYKDLMQVLLPKHSLFRSPRQSNYLPFPIYCVITSKFRRQIFGKNLNLW